METEGIEMVDEMRTGEPYRETIWHIRVEPDMPRLKTYFPKCHWCKGALRLVSKKMGIREKVVTCVCPKDEVWAFHVQKITVRTTTR